MNVQRSLLIGLMLMPFSPFAAAAPVEVCRAITLHEGDPVPTDACAVNIIPRESSISFSEAQDAVKAETVPVWKPLDQASLPGIFYDQANIKSESTSPKVFSVQVAWFYATPRHSESAKLPYSSASQRVQMNCSRGTFTVTETMLMAGTKADGALVDIVDVDGMKNAAVSVDPVQAKLRGVVCSKTAKK